MVKRTDLIHRKAGVIPYVVQDGEIRMKFFIPSDPDYGGPDPQIAKGEIDPGETAQQAAIREGTEEVGLVPSNIKRIIPLGAEKSRDNQSLVVIYFFLAELHDPDRFVEPGFEAGATMWLTPEEFAAKGRKIQRAVVQKAVTLINQ